MAEVLAFVSLLVGIFAVFALVAARAREVRANARLADLEDRVEAIAAHVGLPAGALPARAAMAAEPVPAPSAQAVALYAAGKKIEAIKLYRTESGVGLADAKRTLDGVAARVTAIDTATGAVRTGDQAGAAGAPLDGRNLFT